MKTMAGIVATGVTQRNGVLVFAAITFRRARVTDLKAPRCLTCLNTGACVLSEKYHTVD